MNKTVPYLLYAFAVATVLPMSATSIALALLLIVFLRDFFQKTISMADFKKDSLLYVALFAWKAFTRALATSIRDIPKIKECLLRLSQLVTEFEEFDEIDINPLLVYEEGKGAIVLDARFLLR